MSKELGLPGCFWFLKTTVIATSIEHQVRVRVFAGATGRPALGPSVEFKEGSESPTPAELQQAQCPPRPGDSESGWAPLALAVSRSPCHWQ